MAIMDWHSRYVLAWRLSNTLEVGFCIAALKEALSKGQPEIFNTDQGSQFTGEAFCGLLLLRGIKVSMDGKGRYLDNIFVERLWRSVKYEEVYLKAYRNGSEARRGIDAYLDLYNRERPHQSLGYRTPAQVFAEGRPLRCLPEQASTLSSREVVSDFPAGVSLNLASSLSLWGPPHATRRVASNSVTRTFGELVQRDTLSSCCYTDLLFLCPLQPWPHQGLVETAH